MMYLYSCGHEKCALTVQRRLAVLSLIVCTTVSGGQCSFFVHATKILFVLLEYQGSTDLQTYLMFFNYLLFLVYFFFRLIFIFLETFSKITFVRIYIYTYRYIVYTEPFKRVWCPL